MQIPGRKSILDTHPKVKLSLATIQQERSTFQRFYQNVCEET